MKTKRDPIDHVKKLLIDAGHATEEELKEIDREIRAVVTEAPNSRKRARSPIRAN